MSAPPFMQMYWSDYFGDTRHLTCEQHGAYLQLLGSMWLSDGSLPNDARKLAKITGCTASRWAKIADDVMAFFVVAGDRITHNRVEFELEKAREKSIKRAEAGSRGGRAKSLKNNDTDRAIASVLPEHLPEPDTRDTTEPKGSSVSVIVREPSRKAVDFERFWAAYPKRVAKDAARKAFDRAIKRASLDEIVEAVERQRNWEQWQRGFIPNAATWLNAGQWADEEPPGTQPNTETRKAYEPANRQTPDRNDKLRAMLAGAMAASDDAKHGL